MNYRYVVTVAADTREQAEEVLAERLGHDEDYGFDYALDWSLDSWDEDAK